jgi:HAD superfamily hydrolase (TIGR01548 family)
MELFIKQDLLKPLPLLDALLLDVDGVILDTSESYREVICDVVQHYAVEKLGLQDTGRLIEPHEADLFKGVAGFNSDWDLTLAAVSLVVAKKAASNVRDTAGLREVEPTWDEFTLLLRRRENPNVADGVDTAEKAILDFITPQQRRDYAAELDQRLVTQLCEEMYGGEDACEKLYGYQPQYLHGEGYYKRERVLLDKNVLPPVPLGLVTGRSQTEARLAMRFARLERDIPEENWVTPDDRVRKPDGRTLLVAQEKMGFKNALYVGDTLDDWRTVQNYRGSKGSGRARVWGAIILPATASPNDRRTFLEAGAEIVAPDINTLLGFLKHTLRKN